MIYNVHCTDSLHIALIPFTLHGFPSHYPIGAFELVYDINMIQIIIFIIILNWYTHETIWYIFT